MISELNPFLNCEKTKCFLLTQFSENIGLGHLCRCESLKADLTKLNQLSLIICFVESEFNNDNYRGRFEGVIFLPFTFKAMLILQLRYKKDCIFVFDFPTYTNEEFHLINDLYYKPRTFIFDETHNYPFKNKTIINTSAGSEKRFNPSYHNSNSYILGLKYVVLNGYLNNLKEISVIDNQVLVVIGGTDHLRISQRIYDKVIGKFKKFKFLFINPQFPIHADNALAYNFLQKAEFYKLLGSSCMIISGVGQTLYEINFLRKKCFTIINSNISKCEIDSLLQSKIILEYGYPHDKALYNSIIEWLSSKNKNLQTLNPFFTSAENSIVDILVKTLA